MFLFQVDGDLRCTGAASSLKRPTRGQALVLLCVYKHVMCTLDLCARSHFQDEDENRFPMFPGGSGRTLVLSPEALYLLHSETSWVRWVPGDHSTLTLVSESLVEAPAASDGGPWQRQANNCLVSMTLAILSAPCPVVGPL